MSSIKATYDVQDGRGNKYGEKDQSAMLFPPTPAFSRARADSFSIRPALAVLQNTFGGRKRATSVSDSASQHSKPRSPVFTRFPILDPRPRTTSTATVVPPSAKPYPSLTVPIVESPDESISRAPRIPSFYDMDVGLFSHDLGITLGLNPRFSSASTSTVRAQEDSTTSWSVHGDHIWVHSDRETFLPLADSQARLLDDPEGGSTNARSGSISSATRVGDTLTRSMEQPIRSAPSVGTNTSVNTAGRRLDTDIGRHPESLSLGLSSPTQPSMQSASMLYDARASPSHAGQGEDLYLEGASTTGVTSPPPAASSISPAAVSPARTAGVVSPTQSVVSLTRDQSFVTVSSAHSAVAVSPTRSMLASSPVGSLPSSPVAMSTSLAPYSPPSSTSPSHPTMVSVPFPSSEDNGYASDGGSPPRYPYPLHGEGYSSRSDVGGYDTPTLYTGTTNTSPSLSVTRIGTSEPPPALRLGPGIGFAGVGTYASGANVQAGTLSLGENTGVVEGVVGSRSGLETGARPLTTDSGISGVDREKDYNGEGNGTASPNSYLNITQEGSSRSIYAESSIHSFRAESSTGRSFQAECSDQSVHAESSSIASGIRARVTSLRAPQALAALIPAFMKRARRKSSRMRDDEAVPRLRGRAESNAKGGEGWVEDAERPDRIGSSCARTESSCAISPHPTSDDEHNISPSSSHLDLLSPDPFASTVALKVGAWSEMYAGRTNSITSPPLPPLPYSADDRLNAQSEYSGSIYGDDDSEEESSIRIYSHGRGRSLSQPDVYTIPIEPLHQATPTRRTGRSLDRRRGHGNWRRPALPARPSLPSLSTLTRKNVIVPMPRSAAAARFPSEPWDDIPGYTLPGPATRGLGSLIIPHRPPHSPVRSSPFPRSPMHNLVRMASESSIAEDEDEGEDEEEGEDEDEDASRILSGGEDDKVWWSGPSSRVGSSPKSSFVGSIDEPTVSMPAPMDPIFRDSVASTIQPRESIVSQVSEGLSVSVRESMVSSTSHEEIDVSSEWFLQTLDELDTPITPPPSTRTSSERSTEDTTSSRPMLNEVPTGVDPRNQIASGGIQGGAEGGSQKQGAGYEWQGGAGGAKGGFNYGGNGGDGNRDNGGDGHHRQAPENSDSSETGSESESEQRPWRGRDTTPGPSFPARSSHSQSMPRPPSSSSRAMNREIAIPHDSSDDEIPLAQRLPTALKAQKSIRLQDKADREERRQRRLDRMNKRAAERAAATGGEGGIAAGDLAKRLLNVQVGGERSRDRSPLPSPRSPMQMQHETNSTLLPAPGVRSRTTSNVSYVSRSRTHTRNGSMEQQAPPNPPPGPTSLSRSGTLSNRRPSAPDVAPPMPTSKAALSRSGTMSRPRGSQDNPRDHGVKSLSRNGTVSRHRGGSKTDDEGESSRVVRSRSTRDPSSARPPMPPMPPMETLPAPGRRPSQPEPYVPPVVEQRIYIGDRQRFIVVDIGAPNTTAGDVLDMAKQRGELDIDETGSWQLWEQSNECGMERPVRDFELITDVLKAWNPEKRVNVLIIRFSSFCSLLKPENIPSSSPLMAGWVMWISRPGKWSKRWLELKEHGIFACKNEKGKDRTHLCSLSHFDGYIVTHVPRAPKPYVFAVRSTDINGVFEKEEDSSHIFSCDRNSGELWLARILLARSYILQQERTVLFRPANSGSTLTSSKSMLSRSGTKKSTVLPRAVVPQYPSPLIQDSTPSPFVQGSLLAKAAANGV
ncbi:unnamed protein product [Rhizoctonia solani]|uniref:PH domain-containing protein n=1 Tax=Rhizoctonia solani TaxID=456999 RepID=A0A8H2X1W9_9AGAM|nr:unnamed protein product [Rhizoctonia solani]